MNHGIFSFFKYSTTVINNLSPEINELIPPEGCELKGEKQKGRKREKHDGSSRLLVTCAVRLNDGG